MAIGSILGRWTEVPGDSVVMRVPYTGDSLQAAIQHVSGAARVLAQSHLLQKQSKLGTPDICHVYEDFKG